MGGKPLNGSREEWVAGLGCYAGERKKEGRIKERGDFAKGSSINLIKYLECLKTPKGTKKAVERNQTRQKSTINNTNKKQKEPPKKWML